MILPEATASPCFVPERRLQMLCFRSSFRLLVANRHIGDWSMVPRWMGAAEESGNSDLPAATVFETGSNVRKTCKNWPPAGAAERNLFFGENFMLSPEPPQAFVGSISMRATAQRRSPSLPASAVIGGIRLISAGHQQIRALRDRVAHSKGGTTKCRDFDALSRDLTGGIEITMPIACVTKSPSPLAIAQGSFWVLFLSEKEYHSGGAELSSFFTRATSQYRE